MSWSQFLRIATAEENVNRVHTFGLLGCRHLLSQDPVGIEIQTHMVIIACMLISLWTGPKPTLRTYEMICYCLTGLADEEDLLAHIVKLPRHSV